MIINSNSFLRITTSCMFQNKSNSNCLMSYATSEPDVKDMFVCVPKKLLEFNKTTEDLYLYNPNTFNIEIYYE